MRSILEEMYLGNLEPCEGPVKKGTPYADALKLRGETYLKLSEALGGKEKELFEAFCEANGEFEEMRCYRRYAWGVRFGVLLMSEVFQGRDEAAGE